MGDHKGASNPDTGSLPPEFSLDSYNTSHPLDHDVLTTKVHPLVTLKSKGLALPAPTILRHMQSQFAD